MATKKDQEVLQDLIGKFNSSLEHPAWQNFSKNAPKDFRYKQGEQWTDSEKKTLSERGQAATVENEIHPIIERLRGKHKSQKSRIIFRGRNLGSDEQKSNILTDLSLHTHQISDYEFEEGDMFDNGNTCGFGVMETKITFSDDLQPQVINENTESLDIFPDPQSKKYNWNKDADFITRAKWMPVKKAQALYPKFKNKIGAFTTEESSGIWDDREDIKQDNYVDTDNKRIRVMETWWKKYETRRVAMDEEGRMQEVGKNHKGDVLTQVFPKMQKTIWIFNVILENGKSPYDHDLFPFSPYFVYRKKDGEPYSTVRLLEDVQDEINKRRSKALHLLNTNQAIFEDGAVVDEDDLKKQMAKPDGLVKFRRGFQFTVDKNVEVANTQMSFQQESKMSIPRISGISDEAMGRRSEIRSGVGLQRKQLMTEIIAVPVFDNLRRTRKMIGKLEYELYKQYYREEKHFLITDQLGQDRPVQLDVEGLASIQEGIYDVIIEEAQDTTTIQDEQFQMIQQMLQGLALPPQISMALLPMLFQASQLRSKDDIVKRLEQMAQAPPPPEKPKMSLNITWDNLTKQEKAAFAQDMGKPELAQYEMVEGIDGEPPEIDNTGEV